VGDKVKMTDTTDDIAEEISFQAFDDDCHLLAQSACNMRMARVDHAAKWLSKQLEKELTTMDLDEAVPLARAFSHYLNLMGIAETHHQVRRTKVAGHVSKSCDDVFNRLIQSGYSQEEVYNAVCKQKVEIVLTAHPTQINRRTLQYKHLRIAHLLERNDSTPKTNPC
jgi:phosphoenolpyruvate carboxylase